MSMTSVRTYVARSGTSATNTTAVALVAATAKTPVAVLGSSADTISLERLSVTFASATSTDAPAVVEIGIITALGTATAFTPVQATGSTLASSCTAGYNHTVEPTYNRIVHAFHVPVYMGGFYEWAPLGFELQCDPSQGLGVRITSPAAASCLVSIMYAE